MTEQVLKENAKEIALEMINEGLKQCNLCDQIKPLSMFYNEPNSKKGKGKKSKCKDCYEATRIKERKRILARDAQKEAKLTLEERLITETKQYNESELTLQNYKEPLRKVENGYGYQGVLISTVDNKYIQCHICGKLFSNLSAHVKGKHKIIVRDYKSQFGLAFTTALVSEDARIKLKQATLNWLSTLTEEQKVEYKRIGFEAYKKSKRRPGQPAEQLESKNKKGTCPDQLLQKIRDVAEVIGHTPSKKEFIAFTGTQRYVHLIYKTFGSWVDGIEMAGFMPKEQKHLSNKRYKYTDEQLLEYLRHFTRTNKKIPTQTDWYRNLLPYYDIYTKRFGSIENARQEAGVYEILEALSKD